MDPSLRRCLDTAREIAPELVRRETPVTIFLATERGNAAAAALRWARYWQARRDVFGELRWLLPLLQTGMGALNRDDIDLLRTGFLTVIPRPGGGCLALYNEGNLTKSPGHGLTRCIFYLVHVFCQYVQDTIFLHVVTSQKRPPLDLDPVRWEIQRTAIPMRVSKIMVAQSYEPGKEELIDFMAYQLWRATSYKSRHTLDRVAANSVQRTLASLEHRGLPAHCLPRCLGGNLDQAQMVAEWVRCRVSVEDAMAAAPLKGYRPCAVAQVTNSTAVTRRGTLLRALNDRCRAGQSTGGEGANTAVSALSDYESKKQRSAMYSRRHSTKRRLEILTLKNQVEVLQTTNEELRMQNIELEQLLTEAQQVVAAAAAEKN